MADDLPLPPMKRFTKLLMNDVLVGDHWAKWQDGQYDCFEQMLICLCVDLATEKSYVMDKLTDLRMKQPSSIVNQGRNPSQYKPAMDDEQATDLRFD